MKLAIVLNTSWNIYNFRLGLIRSLISEGHEIYAIAPKDNYSQKLIKEGCTFEEVKMDSRGANPIKDLALTFELYSIYKKVRPDVILHYTIKPNIYGTFAAKLLGIPTINNVCGLGTAFLNKNLVSRIAILMYKASFKFSKLIFFQNDEDKKFFIENKIIKNKNSDVLPGSGINLDFFKPESFKRNKQFTFLLISRLIHDKGIVEYIQAIEKLKSKGYNARFTLLGSKDVKHKRGISEELIQSWIDNNNVEYLGSTEDVRPYIKNSDCIVLPSYREGTPRSLLEAASTARPIVATDVAGCNNIVSHNKNGFLCKLKDADDLADKMEAIINLPDKEIEKMGLEGRKIAENRFSEKLVINKYQQAIGELAK